MSVEKLDFHKVTKESIPYTLVSTYVIQNITDAEAGFIWIYLCSLPPNWDINKNHIQKRFGLGDKATKRIFSFLNKSKLIEYIVEKDEKGKILGWTLNVLCGDKFISKPTGSKSISRKKVKKHREKPTGSISTRVENHTGGKEGTTKEIDLQITNKTTKPTDGKKSKKVGGLVSLSGLDDIFGDGLTEMEKQMLTENKNRMQKQDRC